MPNRDGTGPDGKGRFRGNQMNGKTGNQEAPTTEVRGRCKREISQKRQAQERQKDRMGRTRKPGNE